MGARYLVTAGRAKGSHVDFGGPDAIRASPFSSAHDATLASVDVYTRRIDEHKLDGLRLGRHVEHDPRSRAYLAEMSAGPLVTVHHRRYGRAFDQGQVGSCTGNATAGAINTKPIHVPGTHLLTEEDALTIYEHASALDNVPGEYPPDDTGSSGLAAAKAAKAAGWITSYRHAFGIADALRALQLAPVITGVDWFEGFDDPDDNGFVNIRGQVRGGHEFEVLGYVHADPAYVVCENSWGVEWGDRGRFRMTVDTWARLLSAQGDVTVLVR